MSDDTRTVTLTKMCLKHGIGIPREGALAARFQAAFPAAHYDDEAGEWRMEWKKGGFAESNARLEAFLAERGVGVVHVDKC
ncbi:hypothetical protein E3U26_14440 (plasmid) [Paracoccus ferrooxidans]|nr:hypothetical protein E3U26_14440 [Paracoccus ferrooxidans]